MSSASENWSSWHAERERDFAAHLGWLTLVSYEWVPTGPGALETFPGVWHVDDDAVIATFIETDVVERDGEPVVGDVVIKLPDEGSHVTLHVGSRYAEVAKRGGDYAVRVRDADAPLLREFDGIPTFDYNDDFVLNGVLVAKEPYGLTRGTARQDLQEETTVVAELHIELPDTKSTEADSVILAIEGDLGGELLLVFHDDTNGRESAEWRFVTFRSPWEGEEAPAPEEARDAMVDFNYALNFPSAFTDFGTCPRPLADNRIPLAIEAGEQRPNP